MLFNSTEFIVFYLIVYSLYWSISNKPIHFQNILLLVASYYFYACWDWRFLFLLLFSTLLDYSSGIMIGSSTKKSNAKLWLYLSVTINLGILAVFKYYNFFVASFVEMISKIGLNVSVVTMNIILPVGISFYTFHGLSYIIDVYKDRLKAEKNFINYALFVSFFPLLVAGPIERATHLLPQIKIKRVFSYSNSVDGLRQILWGLFKKIVVADVCASIANDIFSNHEMYSGSTLFLGAVLFSFQIYGDFSGYSDIALGTARLFGIELLQNFSFPYFSRDIAEFWRRWHISLSSWFRDYLYIPLGGSKVGKLRRVGNTFIIFTVSGLWHGANWTFILWGILNAIYFLPLLITEKNRINIDIVAKGKLLPSLKDFFSILTTFLLTVIAWIFFRSESINHTWLILQKIFSSSFLLPIQTPNIGKQVLVFGLLLFFVVIEWVGREHNYAIQKLFLTWKRSGRWLFYYLLILLIFLSYEKEQQFIYFQF